MAKLGGRVFVGIFLSCIATAPNAQANTSFRADSIIAVMENNWNKINDCTCILESFVKKDETEQFHKLEYMFMKPQWIKMKIIAGDNKGTTIVFDPLKKRVLVRIGGIMGLLPLSLSPDNPKTQSIRGHRSDNNHIGWTITRWKEYLHTTTFKAFYKDGSVVLEALGVDSLKYNGTYKELLYLNPETAFPVKIEHYSYDGELLHWIKMYDIRTNTGLKIEDFEI